MGLGYSFIYELASFLYKCVYKIKSEGSENLPAQQGYIIASNHRSFADPPVIAIAGAKAYYSFVAKEELFKRPVFGWLIRKLGAFPITRGKGDTAVIDTSVSKVREGRNLVIFPEGTRHLDGKVGKGKTGVALIAAKAAVPVVPVGIVFNGKLHFRSTITVRFGKPFTIEELGIAGEPSPRELHEAKNKIMNEIKLLVEGE